MMHKIIINGREDAAGLSKYYSFRKPMYESGETVSFSVHTATDTDYKVSSAQVAIRCESYQPSGISTYSFIMPDTDVDIDISAKNSIINGGPMPDMGWMTMGMMGMMGLTGVNIPMNTSQAFAEDPYPWEGKPKFCPECGVSTKGSNKFCRECGTPLQPKK